MPRTSLPACDGRCCRNPFGTCYHQRTCAHHQVDEAEQKLRDHLSAAAEIARYNTEATKVRVIR